MSTEHDKIAPLAYENPQFLNSPDGRILRMMSEYVEPLARFRREQIQDTVVFFGSARFLSLTDANKAVQDLPAETDDSKRKLALASVDMARYYEDARRMAFMLSQWAATIPARRRRFVVTTGGGPGIMEAANRGAREAGGKTIGLNIRLPFEQYPNPYITPALNFEFHYFFMRKFWFSYLAKAMVIFPGGYGSMDELMEVLTLVQTKKLNKKIIIVLYGSKFWKEVINFDALVKYGTIAPEDINLFEFADDPDSALKLLQEGLMKYHFQPEPETPAIAKSRDPDPASTQK